MTMTGAEIFVHVGIGGVTGLQLVKYESCWVLCLDLDSRITRSASPGGSVSAP